MEDSQELKNLKAELEAATAELERLTKRASGLPSVERAAVEGIVDAKRAHARGEAEKPAIEEARHELHQIRDERDELRYEIPEARRLMFSATIAVEKQVEHEAGEQLADAWAQVDAERAVLEAAQQAEAEAVGRATRLEGIISRAQRTPPKPARLSLRWRKRTSASCSRRPSTKVSNPEPFPRGGATRSSSTR